MSKLLKFAVERVVWDSSFDIYHVTPVNVKKKTLQLIHPSVYHAMSINGVTDGQTGANGAAVRPNVVAAPAIESVHVMEQHQVIYNKLQLFR